MKHLKPQPGPPWQPAITLDGMHVTLKQMQILIQIRTWGTEMGSDTEIEKQMGILLL